MSIKVSIVNVKDHDSIPKAVVGAIKLIEDNFLFKLSNSKNIVLKLNLLTSKKEACTQPSFIEGVISYLKKCYFHAKCICWRFPRATRKNCD